MAPRRNWSPSPEKTLTDIRQRIREGASLRRIDVHDTGLFDRAVRDFGSWAMALSAAGVKDVSPHARQRPAPKHLVALTPELLRSTVPTRELARRTGYDRSTIREKRARAGIRPIPQASPEWRSAALELMDTHTIGEIARILDRSPFTISVLRRKLGLARKVAHRVSGAILRGLQERHGRARIRVALRSLDARSAQVLERRHLSGASETAGTIAEEYGVSRQRIQQIERQAVEQLRARLERPTGNGRRRLQSRK